MLEQCLIIQTGNSGNIWIPEIIDDGELEGKVLTVLSKLFCHITCLRQSIKAKILKLSRRKDSKEVRRVRNKLKTTDLKAIGITTLMYIKFIFGFWVTKRYPNVPLLRLFHISLIWKSSSHIIRC